ALPTPPELIRRGFLFWRAGSVSDRRRTGCVSCRVARRRLHVLPGRLRSRVAQGYSGRLRVGPGTRLALHAVNCPRHHGADPLPSSRSFPRIAPLRKEASCPATRPPSYLLQPTIPCPSAAAEPVTHAPWSGPVSR